MKMMKVIIKIQTQIKMKMMWILILKFTTK